jgi:hypothetical protein
MLMRREYFLNSFYEAPLLQYQGQKNNKKRQLQTYGFMNIDAEIPNKILAK